MMESKWQKLSVLFQAISYPISVPKTSLVKTLVIKTMVSIKAPQAPR